MVLSIGILFTFTALRAQPTAGSLPGGAAECLAVKVEAGRARFRVRMEGPDTRYLIVASSLAESGGPYPVQVGAHEVSSWIEPEALPIALPAKGVQAPLPEVFPWPVSPRAVPPPEKTFHLLVRAGDPAAPSNYEKVPAQLRAVGDQVQIYVAQTDLALVSAETLKDLVATFDQSIYPAAAKWFGPACDVDGDGRLTILLSSWLERFANGRQPVDGFVRGADFDRTVGAPLGNRCDIVYLNARIAAGPYLRTVLAHEYTHAVIFSRKVLDPGARNERVVADEEDWLDEAQAHLVEDLHGFSRSNIDHRVRAYLAAPERYSLRVENYFDDNLFRSQGHRGAAYLFLRWCRDHYGPDLLARMVRSPLRGVKSLEAATGESFANLFRLWSIDLGRPPSAFARFAGDPSASELPEYRWVEPGGESDCWSAHPTTTHYTVVAGQRPGIIEVEITAPREANLQVTVVPMPDRYPRLSLEQAAWPAAGRAGRDVVLSNRSGSPVRIESIREERLGSRSIQGTRPRDSEAGAWTESQLSASFGPARLVGTEQAVSLAVQRDGSAFEGPRRLEAWGTDQAGHSVAARLELSN